MEKVINALLKKLDFSPENAMGANLEQPQLFEKAAEYRVGKMRKRIQAEAEKDRVRADVRLKLRKRHAESGDKMTEKYLDDLMDRNPLIREANRVFGEAEVEEEYAKLLLEVYRMRRDILRNVGELLNSQMSAHRAQELGKGKLAELSEKLRNKYPGGM